MQDHLEINDIGATFETAVGDQPLRLAIHHLNVRLRHSGLDLLVKHLIRDVDVAVHPEEPGDETGVDLVVQATQWGLGPRIRVQLRMDGQVPPAVRVDVQAASRWSPLDWTMHRIVRDKLNSFSKQRSELTREGPETFRVDVHRLLGDLIAERGVPVRWDAWLSSIESTREDVLMRFTSEDVNRPAEQ